MRVVILENAAEVSLRAAEIVSQQLSQRAECVLGLATGSTPLATYEQLISLHRKGQISFAKVTTFNLDEYVGLGPDHPQSYRSFMQRNFFDHIDIPADATHIPDGLTSDDLEHCRQYEQQIVDIGGIDLQLLGLGTDGHIAFNEPGSSLASRTRLAVLTEQTRRDNARFFRSIEEVPRMAISMGIGTILESRRILLLATGAKKADAVRSFIEGPITSQVPATALQLHPMVTVLLDEPAAGWLTRRDYYDQVEAVQRQFELRRPMNPQSAY